MMFLLFFMILFIMNDCCLVSPQRGRVEVANESRRLARVTIIRIVDGGAMIGTVKALRNKVKWNLYEKSESLVKIIDKLN
jgi:hypothetical protein